MSSFAQWMANLANDFCTLCTGDLMFWFSAILLIGVALWICYLRAQKR